MRQDEIEAAAGRGLQLLLEAIEAKDAAQVARVLEVVDPVAVAVAGAAYVLELEQRVEDVSWVAGRVRGPMGISPARVHAIGVACVQ